MSFFSSDSFYILSKLCSFVKNFFIFLFHFVDHFRVFLSDSLFRLSHPNRFVNNFFIFFKLFQLSELFGLFPASETGIFSSRQLFRLRVSAWYSIVPYFLLFSRLFLSDSVIIPPLFGIVNVFSIIYIIQKIFAIQTILTIIM